MIHRSLAALSILLTWVCVASTSLSSKVTAYHVQNERKVTSSSSDRTFSADGKIQHSRESDSNKARGGKGCNKATSLRKSDLYFAFGRVRRRQQKPAAHVDVLQGDSEDWAEKLRAVTMNSTIHDSSPHPLRTQDWRLELRSGPWRKAQSRRLSFHRNGTVCTEGADGEWWFDVGGLYWDVNVTIDAQPTTLHHKAELHWNVFGEQPRMFRGVITRDRLPKSFLPPWLFRPVVSSFVGLGIGNDTADTSYRHRHLPPEDNKEKGAPPRIAPPTDRY